MNAATLIRAAENDGLRLALTETGTGTVKCIGSKQVTQRWAPQLRQYNAEILAALTAANDTELPIDDADDFWQTLRARIDECDRLIYRLCDLRGNDDGHRADLLAVRKRMAPQKLDSDIVYLKAEIAALTPAAKLTRGRCIECVSVARVGRGERCAHPERSPTDEPDRADCLPAHQCERFIHWRAKL